MKIWKAPHVLLLCLGVSMLLALCSKDTLFDPGNHTLSLPFAFVSLTKQNPLALSDTSGFATSVTVPKGRDVYFIGLASKPQQQLSMSWIFSDGQREDASFIVTHAFFRSGFYHAYFSIWDQAGNLMTDSVSVFAYTMPVVDAMLFPENNSSNVIASGPVGILFRWHMTQADSGDTILSSLLLGTNNAAFDTVVKNSPYQTCYYPLLPSTTYYWRVVIKSRYGGTYSSEIYSFTTAKPEVISKPRIISMLSDTTVKVRDTLLFFAKATDSGSFISEYAWDFNGDGVFDTTTAGDSISLCKHVYQIAATYRAGLRVSDQKGKTVTNAIRIKVTSTIPTDTPAILSLSRDTTIQVSTPLLLYAKVTDASDTISQYAWDFNGDGQFDTTGAHADSCIHQFADTGFFKVVFKATDKNGLFAQDTVKVTVVKEKLQLNFSTRDTVVDFGGSVRCEIRLNKTASNLSFAIDTGHDNVFFPMYPSNLYASYSFWTGNACSWDSVKLRVTSPTTDTIVTGFKVDIRPRQLAITAIDSTESSITVNWSLSQETDFQEYRLYRNSSSGVDTTSELVATITQAGTVSFTISEPNFIVTPKYYRLYQKDKEGVLSIGSNTVFGFIKIAPPSQVVIITPAKDNDTLLSNATIRWRRFVASNNAPVTYGLQINADNAGYNTMVDGSTDTFFTLKTFDTLTFLAKVKVIASTNTGASFSTERQNIYFKQVAAGIMRRIPAGTITDNNGNTAIIGHNFFMDKTEVTQGAYKAIIPNLPSQENLGDRFPVHNVSWYETILYCNGLSKHNSLDTVYTFTSIGQDNVVSLACQWDKTGYRLPTEDEWELAAKGGANLKYATDNGILDCKADWGACGISGTVLAGTQYPPNPYGLYDLAGNVDEWCWDRYQEDPTDRTNGRIDYSGSSTGFAPIQQRSVRGGNYTDTDSTILESSHRSKLFPARVGNNLLHTGFRCVRKAP